MKVAVFPDAVILEAVIPKAVIHTVVTPTAVIFKVVIPKAVIPKADIPKEVIPRVVIPKEVGGSPKLPHQIFFPVVFLYGTVIQWFGGAHHLITSWLATFSCKKILIFVEEFSTKPSAMDFCETKHSEVAWLSC